MPVETEGKAGAAYLISVRKYFISDHSDAVLLMCLLSFPVSVLSVTFVYAIFVVS